MKRGNARYLRSTPSEPRARPVKVSASDVAFEKSSIDADERPKQRTPQEVRAAQSALAVVAVGHPELTSERETRGALRTVLEMLGIFGHADQVEKERTCGPFVGTYHGYTKHVTAYQTPCNRCLLARQRQQDERWKELGVEPGSEIVTPN